MKQDAAWFIGVAVVAGFFGMQWEYFVNAPARAQDIVTKDGEAVCTNWLQFLRDHPDERPIFTGYDKDGQVIKILAKKGGSWRLVILAAAEEARFGCAILQGERFLAP